MKSNRITLPKPLIIIFHIVIHIIISIGLYFILGYLMFMNPSSQVKELLVVFIAAIAVICIDYFANKLIQKKSKVFPKHPVIVHLPDLILFSPLLFYVTYGLIVEILIYNLGDADLPFDSQNIVFFCLFYLVIISIAVERIALIKTSNQYKKQTQTKGNGDIGAANDA